MKREHSILLVSVLFLGILIIAGCTSKEVTSAKVYIQQDDWEKAQEQLEQAVVMYPEDAEAHALLGEAYARKGEFEKMNKEFEASLAINSNHAERITYVREKNWVENFNRGVAKVKANAFAEALDQFKKCEIIDPKRPDSFKNAAFVYLRMDSTDKAIENYETVLKLEPEDTKVMLQLGSLYYDLKDYEKSIATMDRILAIEPDNIEAISQKAFAFDSMGESEKAFEAYSDALQKKPGDPDLLFNLGRLHYMRKDYKEAINQFQEVLVTNPNDYEATLNIGNAYLSIAESHMSPLREGKEMTEQEIKDAKDKAIESYKEAIPFLEKAVEVKADDAATWTNLGVAYINAGEKDKGEAAFQKADEINQ